MPASRTAESLPTPTYESTNDAAENNVDEYESSANEVNVTSENEPIAYGIKPSDVAAMMIHSRKAKKAKNDRKSAKVPKHAPQAKNSPAPATPRVLAQSKRTPKHLADNAPEVASAAVETHEVIDDERQNEIDMRRGFTVTNKRKRSRHELLTDPLDQLVASIDKAALTKNRSIDPLQSERKKPVVDASIDGNAQASGEVPTGKPLTSIIDMYYAALAESELKSGDKDGVPPKPDRNPHVPPQPDRKPIVPPKPDHDPTVHLGGANEKTSLKDAMRNPFAYLAGQLDAARVILQNKQEKDDPSGERTEKRHKIMKRTLGAVGVGLAGVVVWKLGYDMGIADGVSANIPFGSEHEVNRYPGAAAREEAARQASIAAAHNEAILNSPVHNIPLGGGGEAYAVANGADPSVWYQNQAEFLQLFPNEAHLMDDGNVGFDQPGELSDLAKEYWAKKFGQWR